MDSSGIQGNSDSRSENDARFHQLVAEYIDLLNRGCMLDKERIVSDHPDIGHRLLERLELFQEVGEFTETRPALGTLGDYTLRRQIGRGGMGVVYDAWQGSMDRVVALKVLPPAVAADDRAYGRFMQEARAAGKLSHPNVVAVHASGQDEQTPYYAMEYVEGETLAHILARIKDAEPDTKTPFGPKDQVGYFAALANAFADVADGLQHAHSKGVTHRDIKPSNLILDQDSRLRILDFGLARLEGQESLTLSGDFVGTPLYMSPEQARRKKIFIDHRTDVYSLGATMYETLCGRPPLRGKDHADTLSQIIERDPVEPRKVNPRVPKDLETIVLKCLRKELGDRYGTAEALGQDLRRFVRGDPVEAKPIAPWDKAARRLWKYRIPALGTTVLLAVAVIVLARTSAFVARARDAARYDLYVSDMQLAASDWRSGSYERFIKLLDRHVPRPGERDLRGWEWYALKARCDSDCLILGGHSSSVERVAWSRAGSMLATGSEDGTLKLWGLPEGIELGSVRHEGSVEALAWIGGRDQLASLGQDGTVKVWSSGVVTTRFRIDGHAASISCAAWSADGAMLATGDSGGELRVWDAATGRLEVVLRFADPDIADAAVSSVAWSPDRSFLAAGVRERELGPILIWDATTWSEPRRIDGHRRPAVSLAWSPDGERLASGSYRQDVKLWDTASWKELYGRREHFGFVWSVRWSGDGSWLASGGSDGTVRIWNPETLEPIDVLRGHLGGVRAVAWSPDGRLLATGDSEGTTRVWRAFQEQGSITLPARYRASWSPDGRWLASCDAESENELGEIVPNASLIAVFDAATGERVRTMGSAGSADEQCHSLAWSPDGQKIATVWKDGMLRVWGSETSVELLALAAHRGRAWSLVWSPDGTQIATGGRDGLKIWDPVGGTEVRTLEMSNPPGSVAWSPEGDRLAASSFGTAVRLWSTDGWRELPELRLPPEAGSGTPGDYSIAWSPRGDRLACCTSKGVLVVFDALGNEVLHAERGHSSILSCVAWSPDGSRLATGGRDRTVRIWDPKGGAETLMLSRLEGNVLSLSWSPEGTRLAAGGPFSVRVWAAPGFEWRR